MQPGSNTLGGVEEGGYRMQNNPFGGFRTNQGGFAVVSAQPRVYSSSLYLECGTFFLFQPALSIWKFPGQGSNLSHSCDLHHSCGNTSSLTHCTTVGTLAHFILKGTKCSWVMFFHIFLQSLPLNRALRRLAFKVIINIQKVPAKQT